MSDLRSALKSGPMTYIYGYARWAKRRLTGEQVETTGVYDPVPLSPDALCALADKMPLHGRRHFALALGYLEKEEAVHLSRALACLRCAQTLEFESPERLALYSALVQVKYGEPASACIQDYASEEFTPAENALREQILEGKIARLWQAQAGDTVWDVAHAALKQQERVDSLLVVGDAAAYTAQWFPQSRYFLATPEINGVKPEQVAQCGLRFTWGIGPAHLLAPLKKADRLCEGWLEIA